MVFQGQHKLQQQTLINTWTKKRALYFKPPIIFNCRKTRPILATWVEAVSWACIVTGLFSLEPKAEDRNRERTEGKAGRQRKKVRM